MSTPAADPSPSKPIAPPWLTHSLAIVASAAAAILGTIQYTGDGIPPILTPSPPSASPLPIQAPGVDLSSRVDLRALGRLDADVLAIDYAAAWESASRAVEAGATFAAVRDALVKDWSAPTSNRVTDALRVAERLLEGSEVSEKGKPAKTTELFREYAKGLRGR